MTAFTFTANYLNENAKVCIVRGDNGDILYTGVIKDMPYGVLMGRAFFSIEGLGSENDLVITVSPTDKEIEKKEDDQITKVYIKAEDFRDKAWGIYRIDDETELVLEMTHGYSDLYYRNAKTHDVLMEELFFEEPDRNRINEYCREMYKIEFVTTH